MVPVGMGSFDCARLRFASLRMTGLVMDWQWTFSLGSGRVAPLQLEFVAARARLAERIPIRACDGACGYEVLRLRSLALRSAQDDRVGDGMVVDFLSGLGAGRSTSVVARCCALARLAERTPVRACDGACGYGVLRLRSLALRSAQDDRVGGNSAVLWFMQKSRSFAALRMTSFVMGWQWNSCCLRLRRLFQFFEQSSILRQVF